MPSLNSYRLLVPLLYLFLTLFNCQVTGAGVYKWVDEDGTIHYGDRPISSAEKLKIQPQYKRDVEMDKRRDKRDKLLSVFEEERNEKKSRKEEASKKKAVRQENCIQARDDLKQYQSSGSLYKLDKQGNRHVLKKDEYANAIKQAEDTVAHWCK